MWTQADLDALFLGCQREMERHDHISQLVNSMSVTDRSASGGLGSTLVRDVARIGAGIGAIAARAGWAVVETFSARATRTPAKFDPPSTVS